MNTLHNNFEYVNLSEYITKYIVLDDIIHHQAKHPKAPNGYVFFTHISGNRIVYVQPSKKLIDNFMQWRGGKTHDMSAIVLNNDGRLVASYMDGIGSRVLGKVSYDDVIDTLSKSDTYIEKCIL